MMAGALVFFIGGGLLAAYLGITGLVEHRRLEQPLDVDATFKFLGYGVAVGLLLLASVFGGVAALFIGAGATA